MIDARISNAAFVPLPCSAEVKSAAQASYAELCRRLKICMTSVDFNVDLNFQYRYLVPDEVLYSADEKLEELFVVSSGSLKAEIYQNKTSVISRFLMSGDILGVEGIHEGFHSCNMISLTNSVVVAVPYTVFMTLCRKSEEFDVAFVRYISKTICSRREHVRMLASASAQTRVAKFLLWLSGKTEDSGLSKQTLTIHMSRAEIAGYLGMTCETVCRMLGRFRDWRFIEVEGTRIEIKDYFSLARLAKREGRPPRSSCVGKTNALGWRAISPAPR